MFKFHASAPREKEFVRNDLHGTPTECEPSVHCGYKHDTPPELGTEFWKSLKPVDIKNA